MQPIPRPEDLVYKPQEFGCNELFEIGRKRIVNHMQNGVMSGCICIRGGQTHLRNTARFEEMFRMSGWDCSVCYDRDEKEWHIYWSPTAAPPYWVRYKKEITERSIPYDKYN